MIRWDNPKVARVQFGLMYGSAIIAWGLQVRATVKLTEQYEAMDNLCSYSTSLLKKLQDRGVQIGDEFDAIAMSEIIEKYKRLTKE